MTNKYLLGSVCFLVLLACLLITAPARLIHSALADQLAPLKLSGLSGSMWTGRARQAYVAQDNVSIPLGELSWRLKAWSLLLFSPRLDFETRWPTHRTAGHLTVYPGGRIQVTDFSGTLPIPLFEPWIGNAFGGEISAVLDSLEQEPSTLPRVSGQLQVSRFSFSGLGRPLQLGDYSLEIRDKPGGMEVMITDNGGAFAVDGLLTISPQGEYRLRAGLSARNDTGREVLPMISWMGKMTAEGGMQIDYQGRLDL